MSCANTAELIEMPLGYGLDWAQGSKHISDGGERWRHLANTIELSMCSGDAAFCQITLTTCYYYQLTWLYAVMRQRNVYLIEIGFSRITPTNRNGSG